MSRHVGRRHTRATGPTLPIPTALGLQVIGEDSIIVAAGGRANFEIIEGAIVRPLLCLDRQCIPTLLGLKHPARTVTGQRRTDTASIG
jgi:hypothetical protein